MPMPMRMPMPMPRQEAAVARTEALQLRGEREAALGRLHAALEASHTLRRESDRQLLEVRTEREIEP